MPKRKPAKISFWAQDALSSGLRGAAQRQTKLKFAYAINRAIKNRKLLRAATAGMLDLAPRKVADLRSYNLRGFSVEELAGLLAVVNRNEEIDRYRRR